MCQKESTHIGRRGGSQASEKNRNNGPGAEIRSRGGGGLYRWGSSNGPIAFVRNIEALSTWTPAKMTICKKQASASIIVSTATSSNCKSTLSTGVLGCDALQGTLNGIGQSSKNPSPVTESICCGDRTCFVSSARESGLRHQPESQATTSAQKTT